MDKAKLIGSEKQIAWAEKLRDEAESKYKNSVLKDYEEELQIYKNIYEKDSIPFDIEKHNSCRKIKEEIFLDREKYWNLINQIEEAKFWIECKSGIYTTSFQWMYEYWIRREKIRGNL